METGNGDETREVSRCSLVGYFAISVLWTDTSDSAHFRSHFPQRLLTK